MTRCRNHPDRDATAVCRKLGTGFCSACCACPAAAACCGCLDPQVYCPHRTACLIWELARERRRADATGSGPARAAAAGEP